MVVLVRNKDGLLHFYMDFHRLNVCTKKDSYPLLWIQEALESMVDAAHFSTMDFKSRFWQVNMVPGSQQYTTFTMGNLGFYEFTCMPPGLYNAPTTFQCLMQNTLGELNLTYCNIYLDDVIVFGCSEEEHLEHLHVVFEHFREFNLKLKPSKCSFFQSKIVCLAHHISCEGICPSRKNVHVIEEFPMPETFMQLCAFCRLVGHYQCFIKGFTHTVRPLYDVLGKEVKMGLVQLPPEVQEVVRILKDKIQSAPVLVFPNFNKPFLLETDASKEGLGAMLSQKQDDGCYHPINFGSHSPMPVGKNDHSLKLEFLTLKWGVMEHFKEYLAYVLFVVRMDNNPLTYILTTPNLDATGHGWVGMLASFEFALEYQKGVDNGEADALSQVPICHNHETVHSLLEGAFIGAVDQSEVEANEELLCEHMHLEDEVRVQAAKLAPIHVVDWGEAQEADAVLVACRKWLKACKNTPPQKRDALLKKYLGNQVDTEEGCTLFCVCNSLVLSKELLYISTMPKGEVEGMLAFLVPSSQCTVALNGVHHDVGHQGQQRMLALAQEHFWWPMMAEDCRP